MTEQPEKQRRSTAFFVLDTVVRSLAFIAIGVSCPAVSMSLVGMGPERLLGWRGGSIGRGPGEDAFLVGFALVFVCHMILASWLVFDFRRLKAAVVTLASKGRKPRDPRGAKVLLVLLIFYLLGALLIGIHVVRRIASAS